MKNMGIMERKIYNYLKQGLIKICTFEELKQNLDIGSDNEHVLINTLEDMVKKGIIVITKKKKYSLPENLNLLFGRIQGNEKGFAFFIPDDPNIEDMYVPKSELNGAIHGDKVFVRPENHALAIRRRECSVVKVVQRINSVIIGRYREHEVLGNLVIPIQSRISDFVIIKESDFEKIQEGFIVAVELLDWEEGKNQLEGRIVEIIGHEDDPETFIKTVIKTYGLREDFPNECINELDKYQDKIPEEVIKKRRDLRKLRLFTIDGSDAKDLDDAVSIEKLENGLFRLGVHIADVSYYVKDKSFLDLEAYRRATSVYLVDRVLPMLPQKLSNGLCSLHPYVDRLSFSVFMDVDASGKVINYEICESIINSKERMTYENVYRILEEGDSELCQRYSHIVEDLKLMKELALILSKKRDKRGSIDFDFPETKVVLDENKNPIEVKKYEMTIANKIIEEFMILCNETVAEHFYWMNVPFLYRIHELPDEEKISIFIKFLNIIGFRFKASKKITPNQLNNILKKVKGTKEETVISTIMLRSLKKARYSHENLGHFGLASNCYCHFTSPIRRYPDLVIHRIMKEVLNNELTEERREYLLKTLPDTALHCSERERIAEEAERETVDLKVVQYMKQFEGETYEGIISSVTNFGIFIKLENNVEGLIRFESIADDYFYFDESKFCAYSSRRHKTYNIGDTVKVILARADVALRKIEFYLVEDDEKDKEKKNPKTKNIKQRNKKRNNMNAIEIKLDASSRRKNKKKAVIKAKGKKVEKKSVVIKKKKIKKSSKK